MTELSADTARKRRALRQLAISAGLAVAGFLPVTLSLGLHFISVLVVGLSASFLLVPVVLSVTGSVRIATHFFGAGTVIGFGALAAANGGDSGAHLFAAYLTIPVAGMFLLGVRGTIFWVVIAALVIVGVLVADTVFDALPPLQLPQAQVALLAAAIQIAILLANVWFAYQFATVESERRAELEQVNQRLRGMASRLEQAAQRLGAATSIASRDVLGDLANRVAGGRGTIGQAREGMELITGRYREIAALVTDLDAQRERIHELIDVINRVISRLDILALNVGLEAVRSGEAGAGFRVLAGDLRRLSETVVRDAKEIKEHLGTIERKTSVARDVTAVGIAHTLEGSKRIESMALSFDEVCALVEEAAAATTAVEGAARNELDAVTLLVRGVDAA